MEGFAKEMLEEFKGNVKQDLEMANNLKKLTKVSKMLANTSDEKAILDLMIYHLEEKANGLNNVLKRIEEFESTGGGKEVC